MLDTFYTVDEAADHLRLHPKTILRFIRTGRLRATRAGRAYRILRADLETFAGVPPDLERKPAAARATCVVDVPDASPALHQYVARSLQAALSSRTTPAHPIHFETIFDPELRQLKLVIVAVAGDTAALLSALDTLLESFRP